jgi:hypothetical protein
MKNTDLGADVHVSIGYPLVGVFLLVLNMMGVQVVSVDAGSQKTIRV